MGWLHLLGDDKVDKIQYLKTEKESFGSANIKNLIYDLLVKKEILGCSRYNSNAYLFQWIKK
jgi:hypothetical protein